MFLSVKFLCQSLAAVTSKRASHLPSKSKEQNGSKTRFIRSPEINATIAGSKVPVVNLITSSNESSVSTNSLQYAKLDLSKATVVQDCDNGTRSPVVQDCTCSTKVLAAGVIDDAITMVQAVKGVWNDTVYLPILQRYKGSTVDMAQVIINRIRLQRLRAGSAVSIPSRWQNANTHCEQQRWKTWQMYKKTSGCHTTFVS